MLDVIGTLRQAHDEIVAALRTDPRFREMMRIRAAMEAYEPGSTSKLESHLAKVESPALKIVPPSSMDDNRNVRALAPRNSRSEKCRQELQAWLIKTGPHNNREIRDYLVSMGLLGTDSIPSKETSTLLWRGKQKGLFISLGDGRWTVPGHTAASDSDTTEAQKETVGDMPTV